LERAIGQTFVIFGDVPVEVVGVVADAKYHDLGEQTPIFAYFSYRQRPRTDMYLHLKTAIAVDSVSLWAEVRRVAADIDPAVPLLAAGGLAEALRIFVFPQLIAAWVTGIVGAFGLLLGAVGIYGVTAYAISRRVHEIGVRIALGANSRAVRLMMVRQGMVAPLVGMLVGLLGAAAVTRLLSSFLFRVSPLDPVVFVSVPALLGSVAMLATLLPARRAARVDPVVTLRAD
jgi:putative ABC transport system permease protein